MTSHPRPTPQGHGPRTLVLGDSWASGLSKGQGSMSRLLPAGIGAGEVLNLAKISRIVPEVVGDHLSAIDDFRPEVAFLPIGGADSLVFPAAFLQRFIDKRFPPDWQGLEGMMPSARIVRDRRKLWRHKAEMNLKALVKQAMILLFGAHRRVRMDELEIALRTLLRTLDAHGTVAVIIGTSRVDSWTSPRSDRSIRATNRMMAAMAEEYPSVLYVPAAPAVDRWDDYLPDHVHLSREGHQKVTSWVLRAMSDAGGPWAEVVARGAAPAPVALAG